MQTLSLSSSLLIIVFLYCNLPIIAKKHKNYVGRADHTSNPKGKRRITIFKTQNELWDNENNSKKLLIPPDVLDQFKEMYHKFQVMILILTKIHWG